MNNETTATRVKVRIVRRRRIRSNRSPVDLKSYVPVRFRQYLEEAFHDCDGYWYYFNPSRVIGGSNDTGIVHEDTISQCRQQFASLRFVCQ